MAPNDGRRSLSPEGERQFLETLARVLSQQLPMPQNLEAGQAFDDRMKQPALPDHVIEWLKGKNKKDLERIDEAMENWITGRLAVKIFVWIGGAVLFTIGAFFTLTKQGIDLFGVWKGR